MNISCSSVTQYFLAILIASTLYGCGTPLLPVNVGPKTVTHQYQKNYILNKSQKAFVGQPIIRVQDYYVEKGAIPLMEPTENFAAVLPGIYDNTSNFVRGNKYQVIGSMQYKKESFNVVSNTVSTLSNGNIAAGILIDDKGVVSYLWRPDGSIWPQKFSLTPSTARMSLIYDEKYVVEKGYENFELLFSGVDKNTLTLTYREYSPDGLARSAFYQTLTYDSNAKVVRYKNFKIDVLDANNEGITYSVTQD